MTQASAGQPPDPDWQRNLAVCVLGAFSTILAMTLLLPFLPIYVAQLGVHGQAAVVQWSGIAYSATFLSAGLVAPVWGRLGDRYGRKPMLIRASLGMAICMSLMGCVSNIWELAGLRLLTGLAGGYASGATILVAVQAPRERSAWALGTLSAGCMAGNLAGPLIGGLLPPMIGIRASFFAAGGLIFLAFVATCLLLRETPGTARIPPKISGALHGQGVADKASIVVMLLSGLLLMMANMSIEPIITVFVGALEGSARLTTLYAGLAMSAAALGSILSAARLGRLADRVGHLRVISLGLATAGLLLIPQALVTASWQLVLLRLLMGLALGGLLPCMASVIRHQTPESMVGMVMGWSISSQYAGQVTGPLLGGYLGGHFGMPTVFLATSVLMLIGAVINGWLLRQQRHHT
ncbi:MFS transporter [Frateuria aurantia]